MTPQELKAARMALDWSPAELAKALRLDSDHRGPDGRARGWQKSGARILEMERGTRPISGPITVAVEAFLKGYRPEGFFDASAA